MSDISKARPIDHDGVNGAQKLKPAHDPDRLVIPVVSEQATVTRRVVETTAARIHTSVRQREEVVDEPLMRERVTVKTVAINRMVEGERPATRQEGDVTIIPVLEEVLVVEKRLRLKEEIHIRRTQEQFHAPQSVTLDSEEVTVEQVAASEGATGADTI